jgi:hypothetical protein
MDVFGINYCIYVNKDTKTLQELFVGRMLIV